MPIIRSAIKKLHQDADRARVNLLVKEQVRKTIRKVRKTPNKANLTAAFSTLDMAAKKHVIHKNKAARLKSRLSKLLGTKAPKSVASE